MEQIAVILNLQSVLKSNIVVPRYCRFFYFGLRHLVFAGRPRSSKSCDNIIFFFEFY